MPDGRVVRGSIPCIEFLEEGEHRKTLTSAGQLIYGKSYEANQPLLHMIHSAFPNYPSMWSADLIDRARERVWTDWIRRTCIPTFMRVLRARQEEKLEASSLELCRILEIFAAEVGLHRTCSPIRC